MSPGSHPAFPGPVLRLLGEEPSQALHLVLAFPSINRQARPRPGFLRGEARLTFFCQWEYSGSVMVGFGGDPAPDSEKPQSPWPAGCCWGCGTTGKVVLDPGVPGLPPGKLLPVAVYTRKVFLLLLLPPILVGAVSGCSWITWGLQLLSQLKGLCSISPPPIPGSHAVTGVSELCGIARAAGRRVYSCCP